MGFSSPSHAKQPLVAWFTISVDHLYRGLNLLSFQILSRHLKLRHISSLISKKPIEWMFMANNLISKDTKKGL